MRIRLVLLLVSLSCCADVAVAGGSGSFRNQFFPDGLSTTSSSNVRHKTQTSSILRSPACFVSSGTTSLANNNAVERISSLASSSDDSFGTKKRKREMPFVVSPRIDDYAKQQISSIFGSAESPIGSDFVPLSLAGRWSRTAAKGNQPQFFGSTNLETIILCPPEECQTIANAYKQYLTSKDIPKEKEESISSVLELLDHKSANSALPIPISPSMSSNAINLLSQTYSSDAPSSKSVLLSLNSLLINRDGGLFDNLPWSTWSVDPRLRERDAADNVVAEKCATGKRTAYQRFMGKDWQGRSLSLGNLANRIRYLLEGGGSSSSSSGGEEGKENGILDYNGPKEDGSMMSLSMRLLQLEMKEAGMEIAECEQQLAIAKTRQSDVGGMDNTEDELEATARLEKAHERLSLAETSLEELTAAMQTASEDESASLFSFTFPWDKVEKNENKQSKSQTLLISILDNLAEQENPPPYRGAMGYPAKLDSKKEMLEDSILPYSSPYELLLEIIDEQLNSDVIGCVLEPTSLLEGNLVLGGALLLKRKGVQKSTTLSGEKVLYTDDNDSLGNEGVLPRSMYVVECFSDEAIGMAMASNAPILVEEEIYNRAGVVPVELDVEKMGSVKMEYGSEDNRVEDMESLSFVNRVPPIVPSDEFYFTSQLEGERITSEKESNLVRIPLTTSPQLFDGPDQVPQSSSSSARSPVFSTFNPVKNLDEYDELTDDDKARLLIKLESFSGYLPRPRAVRMSNKMTNEEYDDGSPSSLLDDILIPLIDESVRRQYLIRDAERRKDFEEADALRSEVSPRQSALESAQMAREEGLDEEAKRMEEEAELYKALRADVTQDEGAYNRYLDRDEWYERETQARIKRLDKSKFGTLLDGIDLP